MFGFIFGTLRTVATLFMIAVFARVLFSWIPLAYDSPIAVVRSILIRITEPVMGPLRRMLPAVRFGQIAVDLSPILLIVGLSMLVSLLPS